jgi:hypothetical protein
MYKDINVAVGGPVNADYPKVYKTKFLKPGIPFSLQVTEPNTKYVIKYNFVLDGDVTIPANCVLEFDGGSLNNNSITLQNTLLQGLIKITSNCGGTVNNDFVDPLWFGADNTGTEDAASKIQCAIDIASNSRCHRVLLSEGTYNISEPL